MRNYKLSDIAHDSNIRKALDPNVANILEHTEIPSKLHVLVDVQAQPLSAKLDPENPDNILSLKRGGGGVVSALSDIAGSGDMKIRVICAEKAPGRNVASINHINRHLRSHQELALPFDLEGTRIPGDVYSNMYGANNASFWPEAHDAIGHLGLPNFCPLGSEQWSAIQQVSDQTVQQVVARYEADYRSHPDEPFVILVEDYQKMLDAKAIREEIIHRGLPVPPISFMSHIPVGSAENFIEHFSKEHREALLEGMLGADVIGLHRARDVDAILSKFETHGYKINHELKTVIAKDGRTVFVREHPISINPEKILRLAHSPEADLAVERYGKFFNEYFGPDAFITLSVARYDYTKGSVELVKAIDHVLTLYPSLAGKVGIAIVAAPTREEVPGYHEFHALLDKVVSETNAKYGTENWKPVWLLPETLDQKDAFGLARSIEERSNSGAFITSSIADGFALVAPEFLFAAPSLYHLVSRGAGASDHMPLITFNGRNPEEIAETLIETYMMAMLAKNDSSHELAKLHTNREIIKYFQDTHTVQGWLERRITDAFSVSKINNYASTQKKPIHHRTKFTTADGLVNHELAGFDRNSIIFLGLDGVLSNYNPDRSVIHFDTKAIEALRSVQDKLGLKIGIVSGREVSQIRNAFQAEKINLSGVIGLHGLDYWHEELPEGVETVRIVKDDNTIGQKVESLANVFEEGIFSSSVSRGTMEIQKKGDGAITVHYQTNKPAEIQRIYEMIQNQLVRSHSDNLFKIFPGKSNFEIVPYADLASQSLREVFTALKNGDTSHEISHLLIEANPAPGTMNVARELGGATILVKDLLREESEADFRLATLEDVVDLLHLLAKHKKH